MYFPQEEYEQRWRAVSAVMKQRGYDTAVVWGRSGGTYERCGDILYLTNFYATVSGQGLDRSHAFSAAVLSGSEMPELHVGEPDTPLDLLATKRVEWDFDPIRSVANALKRRKTEGRVALVGSDFLPVKYARRLEEHTPGISWVPEDDLVLSVRRIKTPRELACFRRAGETVTAGLNALIRGLVEGKTEAEAAAAAAFEVIRRGGNIHMIPCNHGDRMHYWCRYPLTGYSQDAPKPGDLVRGWVYGPMFEGYWLDPGRTAVAGGHPTKAQRELIEGTVRIIDRLIEAMRPGMSIAEVVALGDRLFEEAGGEKDPPLTIRHRCLARDGCGGAVPRGSCCVRCTVAQEAGERRRTHWPWERTAAESADPPVVVRSSRGARTRATTAVPPWSATSRSPRWPGPASSIASFSK